MIFLYLLLAAAVGLYIFIGLIVLFLLHDDPNAKPSKLVILTWGYEFYMHNKNEDNKKNKPDDPK